MDSNTIMSIVSIIVVVVTAIATAIRILTGKGDAGDIAKMLGLIKKILPEEKRSEFEMIVQEFKEKLDALYASITNDNKDETKKE